MTVLRCVTQESGPYETHKILPRRRSGEWSGLLSAVYCQLQGEAGLCCADCAPPRPDLNWWYLVSTAHISSDKDKIFHWTLAESDPGWSLDFSLLVLIIFTNTAINLASKTNDEIFHLETCIFVLLHISIIYFYCRLLLELDNCRYWAVQKVRHGVTVVSC